MSVPKNLGFFFEYRFGANCHGNHDGKGSTHSLHSKNAELLRGRETLQTGERLHGFLRSVIYSLECWFECLCVSSLPVLRDRTALRVMIYFIVLHETFATRLFSDFGVCIFRLYMSIAKRNGRCFCYFTAARVWPSEEN